MVSAFTYGLKIGMTAPWLVVTNTLAVVTDLTVFFLPTYMLSDHLHDALVTRYESYYRRGSSMVNRIGAFQTATALAFVMPSVAAMLTIALLRLPFWRALAGLFVGSAIYVIVPLAVALPLAANLPPYLIPLLRWIAPAIAVIIILAALVRAAWRGGGQDTSTPDSHET